MIDRVAPELGLFPVSTPEQFFVDRINNLYRKPDAEIALRNVFFKNRYDYQIHLFDLCSRDRDPDSPVIVSSVVSVSSPHLHFPRFSLQPKLNCKGVLGSALSNALNRRIRATPPESLTRVEVSSVPEFDKRYVLFGLDPAEVTKRFSDQIVTHLAQTEWCVIDAERDTLAFMRMDFDAERLGGRMTAEKIKNFVHEVERLYKLFRE